MWSQISSSQGEAAESLLSERHHNGRICDEFSGLGGDIKSKIFCIERFILEEIGEFIFENLKKYRFDFLIKHCKVIVEIDGDQHFDQVRNWKSPEETTELDVMKMKHAISEGYMLIRLYQPDVLKDKLDWQNIIQNHVDFPSDQSPFYYSTKTNIYDIHKALMAK